MLGAFVWGEFVPSATRSLGLAFSLFALDFILYLYERTLAQGKSVSGQFYQPIGIRLGAVIL
jgi:hypothetical protein